MNLMGDHDVGTDFSQETDETKKRKRHQPAEMHDRRTLMVVGLPKDTTSREVQNMFAFWPGFLKVQLYDSSKSIKKTQRKDGKDAEKLSCFVLFESQTFAFAARDRLNGYVFDQQQDIAIHATLAQKNLVLTSKEKGDLQSEQENIMRHKSWPNNCFNRLRRPQHGLTNQQLTSLHTLPTILILPKSFFLFRLLHVVLPSQKKPIHQ